MPEGGVQDVEVLRAGIDAPACLSCFRTFLSPVAGPPATDSPTARAQISDASPTTKSAGADSRAPSAGSTGARAPAPSSSTRRAAKALHRNLPPPGRGLVELDTALDAEHGRTPPGPDRNRAFEKKTEKLEKAAKLGGRTVLVFEAEQLAFDNLENIGTALRGLPRPLTERIDDVILVHTAIDPWHAAFLKRGDWIRPAGAPPAGLTLVCHDAWRSARRNAPIAMENRIEVQTGELTDLTAGAESRQPQRYHQTEPRLRTRRGPTVPRQAEPKRTTATGPADPLGSPVAPGALASLARPRPIRSPLTRPRAAARRSPAGLAARGRDRRHASS